MADALSRLPSGSLEARVPVQAEVSAVAASLSKEEQVSWAQQLREDQYFGPIVAVLEGREKGSSKLQQRALRFKLVEDSGMLLFAEGKRVCVPKGRKLQLLQEFHDVPHAGHVGADKCHLAIARSFFWPMMRSDVRRFVRSCDICQKVKPNLRPEVVAPQPLPIPAERWEVVSMDWITGLPVTQAGFNAVLTVTDNLTGRVRLLRTRDTATTAETAQLFLENIFAQHGLPRKIISDRDPKLTAAFWQELMRLLEEAVAIFTIRKNNEQDHVTL